MCKSHLYEPVFKLFFVVAHFHVISKTDIPDIAISWHTSMAVSSEEAPPKRCSKLLHARASQSKGN